MGMEKTERSKTSWRCRGRSIGLKPIWCCSAPRSELPAVWCTAARSDAQNAPSDAKLAPPCACLRGIGETGKQPGGNALAARELRGRTGNRAQKRGGRRRETWKRGTPEGEERGARVGGLDDDHVAQQRGGALLGEAVPRGYQREGFPARAGEKEEREARLRAAEADHAVAQQRVGGAGKHGLPAVLAEQRPALRRGEEAPDVEERRAAAGDAGWEFRGKGTLRRAGWSRYRGSRRSGCARRERRAEGSPPRGRSRSCSIRWGEPRGPRGRRASRNPLDPLDPS